MALCITLSYIIPIMGISWGIRDRNQKENQGVQARMQAHALTGPDTGHLLPVLLWMGSNPGVPQHQPSQEPQPGPEAVALLIIQGSGYSQEELGISFLQKTNCEDSHCDYHTCRPILQSMCRTAGNFG